MDKERKAYIDIEGAGRAQNEERLKKGHGGGMERVGGEGLAFGAEA